MYVSLGIRAIIEGILAGATALRIGEEVGLVCDKPMMFQDTHFICIPSRRWRSAVARTRPTTACFDAVLITNGAGESAKFK